MSEASDTDSSLFSPLQGENNHHPTLMSSPTSHPNTRPPDSNGPRPQDDPSSPLPQLLAEHLVTVKLQAEEKIHSLKHENRVLRQRLEAKTDEARLMKQKLHVRGSMNTDPTKRTLDFSNLEEEYELEEAEQEDPTEGDAEEDPIAITWNLGNQEFSNGRYQDGVKHYTIAAKMLVSNLASAEAKASRMSAELEELSVEKGALEKELVKVKSEGEREETAHMDRIAALERELEKQDELAREKAEMVVAAQMKDEKLQQMQDMLDQLKSDNFRLSELEAHNRELEGELQAMQEKLQVSQAEKDASLMRFETQQAELDESSGLLEATKAQLEAVQREAEMVKLAQVEQQEMLDQLQKENMSLQEQAAQVEIEFSAKVEELENSARADKDLLRNHEEALADMNQHAEDTAQELERLRGEATDLATQLSDLKSANESLQLEGSKQLDAQQAEVTRHVEENGRLQDALSKLSNEMETIEEQYKRDLKVKEDLSTMLHDKLEETLAEVSSLKKAKTDVEGELERLRMDLVEKEKELEQRSSSNATEAEHLDSLVQEKELLTEEKKAWLEEKESLERAVEETKRELGERNEKFKKLAKKYKNLRESKEEKPEEEKTKKELLEKVMESESDLKFIVEEQAARIEALQARLQGHAEATIHSTATPPATAPTQVQVESQSDLPSATANAFFTQPTENAGELFPSAHTEPSEDAPVNAQKSIESAQAEFSGFPKSSGYEEGNFATPQENAEAVFGSNTGIGGQGYGFPEQPTVNEDEAGVGNINMTHTQPREVATDTVVQPPPDVVYEGGTNPTADALFGSASGGVDSETLNAEAAMFPTEPPTSGGSFAAQSSESAEGFFQQEQQFSNPPPEGQVNNATDAVDYFAPPQETPDSQTGLEPAPIYSDTNPRYPSSASGNPPFANADVTGALQAPSAQEAFAAPASEFQASEAQARPTGMFENIPETAAQELFGAPPTQGTEAAGFEDSAEASASTEAAANFFGGPQTSTNDAQEEAISASQVPQEAASAFFDGSSVGAGGPNIIPVEDASTDAHYVQQQSITESYDSSNQGVGTFTGFDDGSNAYGNTSTENVQTAAELFGAIEQAPSNFEGHGATDSDLAPPADGLFESEPAAATDMFEEKPQQTAESPVLPSVVDAQQPPTSEEQSDAAELFGAPAGNEPFSPGAEVEGDDIPVSQGMQEHIGTRSAASSDVWSFRDADSLSVQASSVANVQEVQQVIQQGNYTGFDQQSLSDARAMATGSEGLAPAGSDARSLIRAMTNEEASEARAEDTSGLVSQLQESQRELNEKKAELELALDGLEDLKAENESLSRLVEDDAKAKQEAQIATEGLQQKVEQLGEERAKLQKELEAARSEAEGLTLEKTELEAAIGTLNEELSHAHSVLSGVEGSSKKEMNEAQEEISGLKEVVKQLSIEVESKKGLLKSKEEEVETASLSLAEMESTIEMYTAKLTTNEDALAKQQRETEYLNEQFQELQGLIVREKEEKKKLQLEIEQIQASTEKRASLKAEENVELEELKSANDILQQEVESIKNREISKVSELEERLLYLQSQNSSLESERVGLKSELELVKNSRQDVEEKDKALLTLSSKWNKLMIVLKRMEYERDRALDEAASMYEFDLSREIEQEVGAAPLRRIRKSPPQAQKPGLFHDFTGANGTETANGGEPAEGWNKYIQGLTGEVDSYRIINDGNGNSNGNGLSPRGKLVSVTSPSLEAEEIARGEELAALRTKCQDIEAEAERTCEMLVEKAVACQEEVVECMAMLQDFEGLKSDYEHLLPGDLAEITQQLQDCLHLSEQTLLGRTIPSAPEDRIVVEEKHADDGAICELSRQVEDCINLAQKLETSQVVPSGHVIEEKEQDGYTEKVVNERDSALAELKSLRQQLALRKSIFGGKAPLQPRGSIVEETMNIQSGASPVSPSRSVKISPRGGNHTATPASSSGSLTRSILATDRLSTPAPQEINPDSPLVTPWSDKYWDNSKVDSTLPPRPAKLELDGVSPPEQAEGSPGEVGRGGAALEPTMRERSHRDSTLPLSQPSSPSAPSASGSHADGAGSKKSQDAVKKRRSNSGKRFVSQMFGIHSKIEAEVSLSDNNSDFASEDEDPEEKPKPVTNVMSDPFTAARNTATRSRSSTAQSYQHVSPKTSPLQYGTAPPAPPINLVRPGSPHLENTPSADYQTSWPIIDSSVASSPPEIVGDPTDSMQTVGASSPFPNSPGMNDNNGLLWVAPAKEEAPPTVDASDVAQEEDAVDTKELKSQVEKLRDEKAKAQAKVKELENQLEIERDARIWRERQHCVTETELERVIEANEELHERLAVLTASLESAQTQLANLPQGEAVQSTEMAPDTIALEQELESCKSEIKSLRSRLEAAQAQLDARQNEPRPPALPTGHAPERFREPVMRQTGGVEKQLMDLRAALTSRELDIKNLTEQLSNKYYGGFAQGPVSHKPRRFRHRQGRGCLSFTRRFVVPNLLVVLIAAVVALGFSSADTPVDVRPPPS